MEEARLNQAYRAGLQCGQAAKQLDTKELRQVIRQVQGRLHQASFKGRTLKAHRDLGRLHAYQEELAHRKV